MWQDWIFLIPHRWKSHSWEVREICKLKCLWWQQQRRQTQKRKTETRHFHHHKYKHSKHISLMMSKPEKYIWRKCRNNSWKCNNNISSTKFKLPKVNTSPCEHPTCVKVKNQKHIGLHKMIQIKRIISSERNLNVKTHLRTSFYWCDMWGMLTWHINILMISQLTVWNNSEYAKLGVIAKQCEHHKQMEITSKKITLEIYPPQTVRKVLHRLTRTNTRCGQCCKNIWRKSS